MDFIAARKRHGNVDRAAVLDEARVANLWDAISGVAAGLPSGSYAEAVADTWPVDLAGVLVEDAVCAFALSTHLAVFGDRFASGRTTHTDDGSDVAAHLGKRVPPVDLRNAAREGWKAFRLRVDEADKIATGLGWDLGVALPHVQRIPDKSRQLAMLKRVADLAGRMHKALRGAKSKKSRGVPGEYHGVERGDALSRITGSELTKLGLPPTEWLLLDAYTRKQLVQHQLRGPDTEGRGPLVVAIDESGSMNGERNEWAKAAAMALIRSAHQDRRPAAVVHWSTTTKVQILKPGDVEGQIDAILTFFGGGTDTVAGLDVAGQQAKALAAMGHRGADVIFITDGEDPRDDEVQAAVDKLKLDGTRLWTISIDLQVPEGKPLRDGATKYVALDRNAMNDPASLNDVVAAL